MPLTFEWDPRKAETNRRKHGITFETARAAFNDALAVVFIDDRDADREERIIRLAMAEGKVLFVVYTERIGARGVEIIRIISARRATRNEQRSYHEG